MKRSAYRDRDYAFGQTMLTLRTAIGLTQTGLADYLQVSRRAVGDWEAGNSYPKVEHLKGFVALAVRHQAFQAGREEEEIRSLWQAARQKLLLDEQWLATLLALQPGKESIGVDDRAQAIDTARALGLLDGDTARLPDRASESAPRTRLPKHNLPAPMTPFVGREQELDELADLLTDESVRLVTLLAPGGMGKTRLALEAAERQLDDFPDGVYFVPLAESAPEHIVSTIGDHIVHFRFHTGSEPKPQVLAFFHDKRILLLLDNFEHLLAEASLLVDLLQAAPTLKLLVTSRERLNLSGEVVFSLSGMACPDADTTPEALGYSAVKLFVQQARLARRDFDLQVEDVPHVARLCRLTAGMPLGIVLAAAWVEMLSPREIADEIAGSLDFLAVERRDLPERQRSVWAVFDYSWKRLSKAEQDSFMQMAVFRGGFTRQAAQVVTGVNVQTLQALVNRALVMRTPDGRYEVHELLRQYAEEQLDLTGEVDATRDAHSQYYLNMLADLEADVKGHRQAEALDEIDADFDNVRAAWEWALRQGHYEWIEAALECIIWLGFMRSRFKEVADLVFQAEQTIQDVSEANSLWPWFVARPVLFLGLHLEEKEREAHARRTLEVVRSQGDQAETAFCLFALAHYRYVAQDYSTSFSLFEESLEHFHSMNNRFYSGWALMFMGSCTRHLGGIAQSIHYFRQSLDLRQAIGDKFGEVVTQTNFGINAILAGNLAEAERVFRNPDMTEETEGFAEAMLGFINFLRGAMQQAGESGRKVLEAFSRYHFDTTRALSLSLRGVLDCAEERYADSVRLAQEARGLVTLSYCVFFAEWTLALACCGLGDYGSARKSLRAALDYACTVKAHGAMTWCLPAAALVLEHAEEPEAAVELLALAYHHPVGSSGWLDKTPLIARLRADLEAALGTDAYADAWARGKALDLEHVAAQLLAKAR